MRAAFQIRRLQAQRSSRLARTELSQPSLGALQLTLELFQAGTRAQPPPVVLGAEEGDPIAIVMSLGPCHLELMAGAHESNSTTE
jgi:hypothetical protein